MWQVVERITNERDLGSERVKLDDAVRVQDFSQGGKGMIDFGLSANQHSSTKL